MGYISGGSTSFTVNGSGFNAGSSGDYSDCKVTVNCSFSVAKDGTTLNYSFTTTSQNGNPKSRLILYLNNTEIYNSGYNSYSSFPTTGSHNGSYTIKNQAGTLNVAVHLYVAASTNTNARTIGNGSITRYACYWTNINVLNPSDTEIYTNGAYFNLRFSDGTSYTDLTNEPAPAIYKPYGTVMTISNIRPFASYALEQVTGATDNGNGTYSKTVVNDTDKIDIHLKYAYTKCGVPTNLSVEDNGDNTLKIKGTVGSDGIQNAATGIKIFGVYNGVEDTPTTSHYDFSLILKGTAGTKLTTTYGPIRMNSLAGVYKPTIKIIAYTIGTVSGYDSNISSVVSGDFIYYNEPGTPIITWPSSDMTHAPQNFNVIWEQPSGGINNPIEGYTVSLECISPEYEFITAVSINDPEICGYEFKSNLFEFNKQYQIRVRALGENDKFNSQSGLSAILNIKDIQVFPNLELNARPNEIEFFNTGDGNINVLHIYQEKGLKNILCYIDWMHPEHKDEIKEYQIKLTNLTPEFNSEGSLHSEGTMSPNIDTYIESYPINNVFYSLRKESILTAYNEFKFEVTAINKYSDDYFNYDSNTSEIIFRIYPASGMFINTENGMKKAIGFKRLEDGSWIPLRELYYNNEENNWVKSVIYDIVNILVDTNDNILVDDVDNTLATTR